MSEPIEGQGFHLRRAEIEDATFLAQLAVNEEIAPYVSAASPKDEDDFLAEIERGEDAPREFGRYLIEVDDGEARWPAGSIAFEILNRRSRIAHLFGLMLHPSFRGRGLARAATEVFTRHLVYDLNFHRVQLECYGYNERAIQHFERSGFLREGVKRKAYWRNGEWVDGVLFALVREDLEGDKT